MKTVAPFLLKPAAQQEVLLPAGAKIIGVRCPDGRPTLLAVVDTEAVLYSRTIIIEQTGQPLPDAKSVKLDYIGSFTGPDGLFLGHVFEMTGMHRIIASGRG